MFSDSITDETLELTNQSDEFIMEDKCIVLGKSFSGRYARVGLRLLPVVFVTLCSITPIPGIPFWSFGPGGLRAQCVLACAMRSLAIVITIVQSSVLFFFFFFLLSPSFAFDPLRGISRV